MNMSNVLVSAGLVTILSVASISGAAYAWHPKGMIKKSVENVTTGSSMSDANTVSTAVATKPGDIIKYTIEVRNDAANASKNYNDMTNTVMTDALPAGVELVSNPAQRQIKENLGTIKPGKKVVKTYTLKVTAKTSTTITNEACFTGNTEVNDNPQKGCDKAVVKVTPPVVTPPKPVTPPVVKPPVVTPPVVKPPVVTPPVVTPEAPVTPVVTPEVPVEVPAELPKTGNGSSVGLSAVGLGLASYLAVLGYSIRGRLASLVK